MGRAQCMKVLFVKTVENIQWLFYVEFRSTEMIIIAGMLHAK